MAERRANPRVKGPFDGYWDGAGTQSGRITDLSVSGCFIASQTVPVIGDTVNVSIALGGLQLIVSAQVVYVEPLQGFAVHFTSLSDDSIKLLEHEVAIRLPG